MEKFNLKPHNRSPTIAAGPGVIDGHLNKFKTKIKIKND